MIKSFSKPFNSCLNHFFLLSLLLKETNKNRTKWNRLRDNRKFLHRVTDCSPLINTEIPFINVPRDYSMKWFWWRYIRVLDEIQVRGQTAAGDRWSTNGDTRIWFPWSFHECAPLMAPSKLPVWSVEIKGKGENVD